MKTIVTGTGRAGTTFLIALLTNLGMDTGFPYVQDTNFGKTRAGLEPANRNWSKVEEVNNCHAVFKKPKVSLYLTKLIDDGLKVKEVLIPVRRLQSVTASRKRQGMNWMADEDGDRSAVMLGRAVEACMVHDIPFTLISFPKMVQDGEYLYSKIKHMGLEKEKFDEEFKKLAHPEYTS
jgi:hypothetical protein